MKKSSMAAMVALLPTASAAASAKYACNFSAYHSLEQLIRYPASLSVKVILPIVRLTTQLQVLRIDAQDEAGCG
jgi:hypothetical protein